MAKIDAGLLNLTPIIVFFLLIIKHELFLMYEPLGSVVRSTASTYLYYILGYYGHARRQDGRQPAAAKPISYLLRRINVFFCTSAFFLCRPRIVSRAPGSGAGR